MRRLKAFLSCVGFQIKKKFFNSPENDINHGCEEWKKIKAENEVETSCSEFDYLATYNLTTRWQTI